jgi:DNA-binding transcriptional LysR family regulator
MDLDSLRIAVEVARRGSFAAVARDRDSEPSSISRVVAAIEKELGLRLFQRTTRRLAATESGRLILPRLEAILEEFEAAKDEALSVSSGPSGTLRLTASVAFGTTQIVPLLPAFHNEYPQIKMDLLLTDQKLDLIYDRIDLAIRLTANLDSDVISVKLMDTRYHVCATPQYWATGTRLNKPADLSSHNCLLFDLPDYRTRWLFRDRIDRVQAVPVQGHIVISNAFALYQATCLGLGPALLPDWLIAKDLEAGRLVDPLPDFHATARDFTTAAWFLYPSRFHLPSKVRATIDFLRKHLSRRG